MTRQSLFPGKDYVHQLRLITEQAMKRKDMASSGSSSEELHNQLGSPHKRQLKMELKMEGSTGRRKPHPIAFILFLEDFRKRRMEEFESALQKDAAKEWDSLFEVEKMTYEKKAMEKVAALEKGLEIYNKLG